ncbi:MAG: ribosome silencing factor [Clostridiales bacterium]|nr:ribosome silencing factor [Clostridiales bacterium]
MEVKQLAMKIAEHIELKKGEDVTVIDISPKASFADYFVLTSVGSDRQMSAMVDAIEELLEPQGIFHKSVEGKKTSGWILMDYDDVVVNVMTREMRERYNIEKVWGDCEAMRIN